MNKIFFSFFPAAAAVSLEAMADMSMEQLLTSNETEWFRQDLQWVMPIFGIVPDFENENFVSSFLETKPKNNRRRPIAAGAVGRPQAPRAKKAPVPVEVNLKQYCKYEAVPCSFRKSMINKALNQAKIMDRIDGLDCDAETKNLFKFHVKKLKFDPSQGKKMCQLALTFPEAQEGVARCPSLDVQELCEHTIENLCVNSMIEAPRGCVGLIESKCKAATSKQCFCAGPKEVEKSHFPEVKVREVTPELQARINQARIDAQNHTSLDQKRLAQMHAQQHAKSIRNGRAKLGASRAHRFGAMKSKASSLLKKVRR